MSLQGLYSSGFQGMANSGYQAYGPSWLEVTQGSVDCITGNQGYGGGSQKVYIAGAIVGSQAGYCIYDESANTATTIQPTYTPDNNTISNVSYLEGRLLTQFFFVADGDDIYSCNADDGTSPSEVTDKSTVSDLGPNLMQGKIAGTIRDMYVNDPSSGNPLVVRYVDSTADPSVLSEVAIDVLLSDSDWVGFLGIEKQGTNPEIAYFTGEKQNAPALNYESKIFKIDMTASPVTLSTYATLGSALTRRWNSTYSYDGSYVYSLSREGVTTTIDRVDSGGSPTTIRSATAPSVINTGPKGLYVNQNYLYWLELDLEGTFLWRAAHDGTSATRVVRFNS